MANPLAKNIFNNPQRFPVSTRLRFRYDPEHIQLIGQQRINKIAPMSSAFLNRTTGNSGYWLEIRDFQGQLAFLRVLSDPFRLRAEHHLPERRIQVVTRERGTGTFEVVVPRLVQTKAVLMGPRPDDLQFLHPSAQLASFALHAD